MAIGFMTLHDAVDKAGIVCALIWSHDYVKARAANGDTPSLTEAAHFACVALLQELLAFKAHFACVALLQELLAFKANIHTVPPPLHVVFDAIICRATP